MTVIITNAYFLADFIFDEYRGDPDVAVVNFKERKNPLTSLLKWVRVKGGNRKGLFNSLLFSRDFRNALASAPGSPRSSLAPRKCRDASAPDEPPSQRFEASRALRTAVEKPASSMA